LERTDPPKESRATLTTPKIVFIIVAAAAPLGAIVLTVPLMFAKGNGPGVPVMFLVAGVTLLLFAFGYAAMARLVSNSGAFYTYIARGLGRRAGVAAAFVAVIAYNAQTAGIVGGFSYAAQLGIGIPWYIPAFVLIALVGFLGYRNIDVSAKILAVLMTGEILLLGALDVGIIAAKGLGAFPLHIVLHSAFSAGAPIALLFAFSCFVGFESAALYAEETRDPQRAIPRATYFAVVLIGIFYSLSAWVAVGAQGGPAITGLSQKNPNDVGKLYFDLMTKYVGSAATSLMGLMILLSIAAATLATHNAASRYMFALGRERLLPNRLGGLHGIHLSPNVASVSQTGFNAVVALIFVLLGLDPYVGLASTMIGLGTTGIVLLQALAGLAVIGFFVKRHSGHWFYARVAPGIGALGCFAAVLLTTAHFSVLTNSSSAILNRLPFIYPAALLIGIIFGTYLKRNRAKVYAGIAGDEVRNILIGNGADDD